MQLKVNGFQKVLRLNEKMWNTRPGTYNIYLDTWCPQGFAEPVQYSPNQMALHCRGNMIDNASASSSSSARLSDRLEF